VPKPSKPQVAICLIRGINVGGAKIVRMEALRALLAKLGYQNAATYIQSGNIVLRSEKAPAACEREIARALPKTFGFSADIMVRSLADWRAALKGNPFDTATHDPRRLLVHCLEKTPAASALKSLDAIAVSGEEWKAKGAWLYAYFPHGIARSKLAVGVERTLKVRATARNWNTALKLLEMGEALESS